MPFSRDDGRRLLSELARELGSEGVQGHLFLVGGAAMALAMQHLPDDWLNDGATGFMLGEDPNATTPYESAGLVVRVASGATCSP